MYTCNSCALKMQSDRMSLHPYQQLRECSTINFFQCNTDKFKSKIEEAIEYCIYRTVTPPTCQDTSIANWLVDYKPILCMIQWSDLFLDHNSSIDDGATALTQVCSAVQKVVWMEHTERLKQFYKDKNMMKQFNDTRLQLLQNILLDIWMDNSNKKVDDEVCYDQDTDEIVVDNNKDNYKTVPLLTRSDRFMLQFISDQITRPFIQLSDKTDETSTSSVNTWSILIQQYTSSLCRDIKSLLNTIKNDKLEEIHEECDESEETNSDKSFMEPASNLDPIANLLSEATFVDGHDADTRIELFSVLISKVRRWVEILMGLKDCTSLNDPCFPLVMIRLIEDGIRPKLTAYRTRVKIRQEMEEHMIKQLDDSSDCSTSRISNQCIIKNCHNIGYISNCGICRHHTKQSKLLQPNPFNWVDYPQDKLQKIMKRLKRRLGGISSKANISSELLKEASRMSRQKRTKRRRLKPPTIVKTPNESEEQQLHWTREAR